MKYKLLFGNNIEGTGKKLAQTFSYFGFETEHCANSTNTLERKLETAHFDGLIFFTLQVNDKICDFISRCSRTYPDLKIYPVITTDSNKTKNKLRSAGAASCLTMPFTDFSLCGSIIGDFFTADEMPILPEIADFLQNKGFPDHMVGFYFLCCAVELAIGSPEMLDKVTQSLYPETARIMNTTYSNVERSIRVASTFAFGKGIVINGELKYHKPTTKELIRSLAREYSEMYGL